MTALACGALAGLLLGVVLHRGQLCLHAAFVEAAAGRGGLLRGWALGVALAAVGYAVLLAAAPGGLADGLNRGLALRPVGNVLGGLILGVGMVVTASCLSGLLTGLGSGMLGASVGLVGWAGGELLARAVVPLGGPGPVLLGGGAGATLPGVLHLPRLPVAVVVLALAWLAVNAGAPDRPAQRPEHPWQWGWRRVGPLLGLAVTAAWALAGLGGTSYGAGSVGAMASLAAGRPDTWLLAFLVGLVLGASVAARAWGGWRVRGEAPLRLARLLVGGVLLGAGGWVAGGCNLGHGLSGLSQLSLSSMLATGSMALGVLGARRLARIRSRRPASA